MRLLFKENSLPRLLFKALTTGCSTWSWPEEVERGLSSLVSSEMVEGTRPPPSELDMLSWTSSEYSLAIT